MSRLMFVIVGLLLSGCEPPAVQVTDLESFDNQNKRDGLVHGTLKVLPPSDTDNAKITLSDSTLTLTKSHVLGIKSELYQPSFRLEGIISPITQIDVLLSDTASLQSLYVKIGDVVEVGDDLALFYQNTLMDEPTTSDASTDDELPLATQTHSAIVQHPLIITAPTQGRISTIYPQNREQTYLKGSRLLTISDERELKFISLLPHNFKEHLGVGDAVNFRTTGDKKFSGQIEKIIPDPLMTDMLNVHVIIKPQEIQKANLTLGEVVRGYVEYGQKSVGVLVPTFAIFDDKLNPMDLTALKKPPFKPATPINAQLWTIKQDERLHLTPIQVIEYRPESDHYLITGVSLTGLIVLTDLPKEAQGKRVRLK